MSSIEGFQNKIVDLSGKPILDGEFNEDGSLIQGTLQPATVAKMIASMVARGTSSNSIRAMDVAMKLYNLEEDTFEIDDGDLTIITQIVEQDQRITNVVKASVLRVLTKETSD